MAAAARLEPYTSFLDVVERDSPLLPCFIVLAGYSVLFGLLLKRLTRVTLMEDASLLTIARRQLRNRWRQRKGRGGKSHKYATLGTAMAMDDAAEGAEEEEEAGRVNEAAAQQVRQERERVEAAADNDAVWISGVTKVFDGEDNEPVVALGGVSFGVRMGEAFGLLGWNGAGKTTLFKIMAGILAPSEGEVRVMGHDVRQQAQQARSHVSMCQQEDVLWPFLTGRQHLQLFASLSVGDVTKKIVIERMIERFELKEWIDKPTKSYSGGTKRKLSVALALISDPQVLLLDEPTTGMDPHTRTLVHAVLRDFMSERRCIVLISHDLAETEALCARMCIMNRGELKVVGSPEKLKDVMHGAVVRLFVRAKPAGVEEVKRFVRELVPSAKLVHAISGTCEYELPRADARLATIFSAMTGARERLGLLDWSVSKITLDAVFASLGSDA